MSISITGLTLCCTGVQVDPYDTYWFKPPITGGTFDVPRIYPYGPPFYNEWPLLPFECAWFLEIYPKLDLWWNSGGCVGDPIGTWYWQIYLKCIDDVYPRHWSLYVFGRMGPGGSFSKIEIFRHENFAWEGDVNISFIDNEITACPDPGTLPVPVGTGTNCAYGGYASITPPST